MLRDGNVSGQLGIPSYGRVPRPLTISYWSHPSSIMWTELEHVSILLCRVV